MSATNLPPLVTVFGGSGFVGRHVVRLLAQRGCRIRVAVRRPDLAGFLLPAGYPGQIAPVQANLRYPDSVNAAVRGADFVVNAVGILFERGQNGFDAVQDEGARNVAAAAAAEGAGLVHISAIGADPDSESKYAASKGRAEKAIHELLPQAVILRPSVIFGPEDGFFNRFAAMASSFPALPLIGGGETRLQPVYVENVAEAAVRAVEGQLAAGRVYELGGPEVMTLRHCLQLVLAETDRKRPLLNIPFGLASLIGKVAQNIPLITPPLTGDQVTLLRKDNVVSEAAIAEGRTLDGIGIAPVHPASLLSSYLVQYRPLGQYARSGSAA